jgi:hypothetical protein
MATFTVQDKKQLLEHDDFINGKEPSGKDGAKSRLSMVEETLMRRDKASNYLIGMSISVTVGIILWLITTLLPRLVADIGNMYVVMR